MSSEVESLRDDKTRAFEVRKFCSIHAGADEHLIEFWEFGEADAPLVSIIIPLYNCERYLAETLDSIVSQSLSSWEAILVDDCSSDGSLEIALQFSEQDHRFVLKRCNRERLSRNRALAAACGSLPIWIPTTTGRKRVGRQITFMTENRFGACMTSYETVNEDGSFRNIVHIDDVSTIKISKKPPLLARSCSIPARR
ncbi:MAG: glycosyltransferase family 2 protein [Eggerthella lenta]